jgi:hypothetical protein
MRTSPILLIILLVPVMAAAQTKVGTTAAPFLEVGAGAKGVAMGESQVATARDVTALYWNPAGVAHLTAGQASFQYNEWIAGTNLSYAALAIPVPGVATLGLQVYRFDSGLMEVTDIVFPDGTGEQFRVQDILIGVTAARKLTANFAIGGSAKYVRSSIWRMSASTIALDLGMQYDTPVDKLKLGFNISNFGGEMRLDGDNTLVRIDLDPNATGNNDGLLARIAVRSWDLPLNFRIGLGYALGSGPYVLNLNADAMYPNNNDAYVNAGAEFAFMDMLFLRGGLAQNFLKDAEGNARFGFGVKLGNRIMADYAWSDRGVLGSTSVIGVTIGF